MDADIQRFLSAKLCRLSYHLLHFISRATVNNVLSGRTFTPPSSQVHSSSPSHWLFIPSEISKDPFSYLSQPFRSQTEGPAWLMRRINLLKNASYFYSFIRAAMPRGRGASRPRHRRHQTSREEKCSHGRCSGISRNSAMSEGFPGDRRGGGIRGNIPR